VLLVASPFLASFSKKNQTAFLLFIPSPFFLGLPVAHVQCGFLAVDKIPRFTDILDM
jgi:hypothetical protein